MADRMPASRHGSLAGALTLLLIAVLVLLLLLQEMRRREALLELARLSQSLAQVADLANREGQGAADRIIDRVSRIYALPARVQPSVATITRVEILAPGNPFYGRAKNGDHLIITPDRAILYDPAANKVVDVVPVDITPPEQANQAP